MTSEQAAPAAPIQHWKASPGRKGSTRFGPKALFGLPSTLGAAGRQAPYPRRMFLRPPKGPAFCSGSPQPLARGPRHWRQDREHSIGWRQPSSMTLIFPSPRSAKPAEKRSSATAQRWPWRSARESSEETPRGLSALAALPADEVRLSSKIVDKTLFQFRQAEREAAASASKFQRLPSNHQYSLPERTFGRRKAALEYLATGKLYA